MAANTLESAPVADSVQKAPAEHPLKADITSKDLREVFGYLRGSADDAAKREAELLSGKGLDFSAQDIYQKSMKELDNFGASAHKAGAHKGDAEKNDPLKGQPVKGEDNKPADKSAISDKDLGAALAGRQHKVEAPSGSPFDLAIKHYKELTGRPNLGMPKDTISEKDLQSALKSRH